MSYRGKAIETLLVTSQSEDAYVEDSYSFGPDISVKQVVRRGHYLSDPFATATFKPDASGRLQMTSQSRRVLQSWKHETYFLEWPLYSTFSEVPFAGLIKTKPVISVSETCREI
jgi:hypothetical protein